MVVLSSNREMPKKCWRPRNIHERKISCAEYSITNPTFHGSLLRAPGGVMAFYCQLDTERTEKIRAVFARELPEVEFLAGDLDGTSAAKVRYLLCWQAPAQLAETFPSLEIIFSSGAGVEQFLHAD